ncbi:MAG: hypothetical protein EZS28_049529 [Streblomastix strix]|uniref:Cyclin N-terminal domain-containing protein n=1 Tax=Streblomastix strix TaxID=222440 RepID=A0A5J4T985_9EUKA|nr:MAG: hypothetical protein EZS28_049529 [Streblomastix strix]
MLKYELAVIPIFKHHTDKCNLNTKDIRAMELPATQSLITSTSKYLVKVISNVLYSKEAPQDQLQKNESLLLKIKSFFSYICEFAWLTGSELIYTIYLVKKLVNSEKENNRKDKDCIMISENNVGTTLVCAVILAMKILRDATSQKNSWWAKSFEMNLELLNQSELAFFAQLDFNAAMDEQQFIRLHNQILLQSDV